MNDDARPEFTPGGIVSLAMAQAGAYRDLRGREGLVLIVMTAHAHVFTRRCELSLKTLATETGLSRRGAQWVIDRLVARGLVRQERRPGRSSVFWIEGDPACWSGAVDCAGSGAATLRGGGAEDCASPQGRRRSTEAAPAQWGDNTRAVDCAHNTTEHLEHPPPTPPAGGDPSPADDGDAEARAAVRVLEAFGLEDPRTAQAMHGLTAHDAELMVGYARRMKYSPSRLQLTLTYRFGKMPGLLEQERQSWKTKQRVEARKAEMLAEQRQAEA